MLAEQVGDFELFFAKRQKKTQQKTFVAGRKSEILVRRKKKKKKNILMWVFMKSTYVLYYLMLSISLAIIHKILP